MTCTNPSSNVDWPAQVDSYHAGAPASYIAAVTGLSTVTVFKKLREHGAKIRPSRSTQSQIKRGLQVATVGKVECPTCHSMGRGGLWLDGYAHRCEHGAPCRGATKGAGDRCLECEPEVRV